MTLEQILGITKSKGSANFHINYSPTSNEF